MKPMPYLGFFAAASLLTVANANASPVPPEVPAADIVSQVYTGQAPIEGDAAPKSVTGSLSVESGNLTNQYSSPYINNTIGANTPYNVLNAGSTATYTVNSNVYSILWGSPNYQNEIIFNLANGKSYSIFGSQLACSTTCDPTGFDLVTFNLGSEISNVELIQAPSVQAFEFGTVTPLPGSIYLFGSALGGLGLLAMRRRKNTSGSDFIAA